MILWYLWIGRAKRPGPGNLELEVVNVGGWLTHGDFALKTKTDLLAVTEYRLTPSRARNEWSRLRKRGVQSVWPPADQDSSGAGGVGLVSLRGAPVTLPTFATAQFPKVL